MKLTQPVLKNPHRYVPVRQDDVDRYKLTNLRQSLSSYVGEAKVIESWLEVPIGDGWVAAYRVVHSGTPRRPKTRILEVRVFPDEGDRMSPSGQHALGGRWSARFLGNRAPVKATFSFDRLRRGVTEK
jgi:hypothetical protein